MNLESFIFSRYSLSLAYTLARISPPSLGRRFADSLGRLVSRDRQFSQVRAVRANQWVIRDGRASAEALDQASTETFGFTGRFLYDFLHYFNKKKAVFQLVEFEPSFQRLLEQNREGEHGVLMVCPHLTNVDLLGHAAALAGMRFQVLSYPDPPASYRATNRLRAASGIDVTPMSIQALRQATARLKSNGFVLTGVDRPIDDHKYRPRFFGRPASLPVGHVRLALNTQAPVVVITGYLQPNGRYRVRASEPVWMQADDDLTVEMVSNAEKILGIIEQEILKAPEQWTMFYPVWPEALEEMS